jgi:hypothetical protein
VSIGKAVVFTVLAWIVGLFLDANVMELLCLRAALPVIVMGACILYGISENEKKLSEIKRRLEKHNDEKNDP